MNLDERIYNPKIIIYKKSRVVWRWVYNTGDSWKTINIKKLARLTGLHPNTVERHMLMAVQYHHERTYHHKLTVAEYEKIRSENDPENPDTPNP